MKSAKQTEPQRKPVTTPISPMRPEMIEYHMQRQLELERAGEWVEANRRNLWLMGAFMSEEDCLKDRVPEMRKEFLARAKLRKRVRKSPKR